MIRRASAISRAVQCPKGTSRGEAAKASSFGFARCILEAGHTEPCDSGPAPEPEPKAAA